MKNLYIIPGFGYSSRRPEYLKIGKYAQKKRYRVFYVPIDWTKPLSKQIIRLNKKDTVFGFSLGAIIARLSYQKTPCKRLILASCSPLYRLKKKLFLRVSNGNRLFVTDIMLIRDELLKPLRSSKGHIFLRGEFEKKMRGKVIKGEDHKLTNSYIAAICGYL
jgi:alpha-beta hydrolase superfamily lysophospholipase